MKKIIIYVLAVFLSAAPLFALDVGIDVRELDPEAIVADSSNRLVSGWVQSIDYIQYYGNDIMMNASVKKSDHTNWYIFYTAPADKKAFHEYLSDVLRYYLEDAFAVIPGASSSGSECEISYELYLKSGGKFTIYAKLASDNGLRGFGITSIDGRDDTPTLKSISGVLKGKSISPLSAFDPDDWFTGSVFISEDLITDTATFSVEFKPESGVPTCYYWDVAIIQAKGDFSPFRFEWMEIPEDAKRAMQGYFLINSYAIPISDLPASYSNLYTPASYCLVEIYMELTKSELAPKGTALIVTFGTSE